MDERKWIERILAGDTQSFSCLVAKYEKMAYTIAFRILENREEAEEAVQDAFVKMYRARTSFQISTRTHVGSHSFLESSVDITARSLALTDTF